jgi:hypothetical protein
LFSAFIGNQAGQNIGADVLLVIGEHTVGSAALDCGQPMPECIGIAWRSALSLLSSHNTDLNRHLVVVHYGFARRLRRDERYPSGIHFVPGNLIRQRCRANPSAYRWRFQRRQVNLYLGC